MLKVVALTAGVGSGSKVFQALLSDHHDVLMIPGYPLTYFYKHWDEWQGPSATWTELIRLFLDFHRGVFWPEQSFGSEQLSLTARSAKIMSLSYQQVSTRLLTELTNKPKTSREFILGLHQVYGVFFKQNTTRKETIIVHIHRHDFLERFIDDFPDAKVLSMLRYPLRNITQRIAQSIHNVVEQRYNKTDQVVRAPYYYYVVIKYLHSRLVKTQCPYSTMLVRHEDLVHINVRERVMRDVANFLEVDYTSDLLVPTFFGVPWKAEFYANEFDIHKYDVNPEILNFKISSKISETDAYSLRLSLWGIVTIYNDYVQEGIKMTILRRLSGLFYIIAPSRIEIKTFISLLSFRSFVLHLISARREVSENFRFYERSGFYRYHHTKGCWYISQIKQITIKRISQKPLGVIATMRKALYVVLCCFDYIYAIILSPILYVARVTVQLNAVFRAENVRRSPIAGLCINNSKFR